MGQGRITGTRVVGYGSMLLEAVVAVPALACQEKAEPVDRGFKNLDVLFFQQI